MKLLLEINNSIYDDIKLEFLYHSYKLEGSTFNCSKLNVLIDEDRIKCKIMEPDKALDMKWFDLNNLPDKLTITTKKALLDYKKLNNKNKLP